MAETLESGAKNNEVKRNHPLYAYIQKILSPEGRQNELNRINTILGTEKNLRIAEIIDELKTYPAKYKLAKPKEYGILDIEQNSLRLELGSLDPDQKTEKIIDRRSSLETYNELTIGGQRAVSILRALTMNAINSNHTDRALLFTENKNNPARENILHLSTIETSTILEIPIGIFESADNLNNWHGEGIKDNMPSNTVINNYAQLGSQSAPPLDQIAIYLYSDGEIRCNSHNAHRVAAAILRGDETIKFRGTVAVILMDSEVEPQLPNYYNQKSA